MCSWLRKIFGAGGTGMPDDSADDTAPANTDLSTGGLQGATDRLASSLQRRPLLHRGGHLAGFEVSLAAPPADPDRPNLQAEALLAHAARSAAHFAKAGRYAAASNTAARYDQLLGRSTAVMSSQAATAAYANWRQEASEMQSSLAGVEGLTVAMGEVASVQLDGERVVGVRLASGDSLECRAVVITSGTFLGSVMHTGLEQSRGGRAGDGGSGTRCRW